MLRAGGAAGSPACASPISAPAPAPFCWRCCPNCRTRTGSAPTSARKRCEPRRTNARRLGFSGRARLRRCDYASALSGPFDLIVSNPPYIRSADIAMLAPEVRDHDPQAALDGGADGLDAYRVLIAQAARLLAPGGALVVEAGQGQADDIEALMTAAGLTLPGPPGPIWRVSGVPSGPVKCPDKVLLERKKTSWNIPRERLRSGHNIGPGSLAPQNSGWSPEFGREPARLKGSKTQVHSSATRCAALDRNVNESLILRLKTYATEAFVTEALGNRIWLVSAG